MSDPMVVATEMCRFAKSSDLLSWLDLVDDVDGETAQAALKAKRSRMQSMQHNPKYKDAAKYLIKNYRTLLDVLADPTNYRAKLEELSAQASLPMLEMAIESVLADGVISAEEQAFLRDSAAGLNISTRVFERKLTEKCLERGVAPPSFVGLPPLPEIASITNTGVFRLPHTPKKFSAPGWWDVGFTDLLLKHVDDRPMRAVDLICGKGWAAQAMLPERAGLEYLGIDGHPDSVEHALAAVTAANLSHRAVIQQHAPTGLPLPDETVDLVLCLMSLRTVQDTRPLFKEAYRLLKPGGRFIAVEPDAMGQQFYYDGNLVEYNDVFRDLVAMVDRSYAQSLDKDGAPGVSLGPRLGKRMRAAGLKPVATEVHLVQAVSRCSFRSFAKRLRERTRAMGASAGLVANDSLLVEAEEVVISYEKRMPAGPGTGAHLLPLFMVVGDKPLV